MPLRLYRVDREGRIVFANQAMLEELGQPLEACLGRQAQDFHPPELAQRYAIDDARVLEGETLHQIEDHRAPDGDGVRKVEVVKVPVTDGQGRVVGIQGLYWDVTDRVELEQRLKASAERFETILTSSADGFWITDGEGMILEVNETYCRLSGYSREELIGAPIALVEAVEDQAELRRPFEEIQRQGHARFATRHRRKDGGLVDLEVTVAPLRSQGYNLAFLRDMTLQNEAERRVAESESRYRSLFDDAAIPIWEEDFSGVKARLDELRAQGIGDLRSYLHQNPDEVRRCAERVRIVDMNQASRQFFSDRLQDATKGRLHRLGSHFESSAWGVFAEELIALAEGRDRWTGEIETRDGEGKLRVLSIQLSVAPEHRHSLERVLVSWIDLTPLRTAEAQRRKAEEELRHAQNMESLGSLAGGIAHDMNNVLAAILGLTSTLQVKCAADEPTSKALGIILHAANRGRDLVKGLTEFARKGLQASRPLDLNELVRREAELLQRTTLQRVEVQLDLCPGLPQVVGEANSLANTLMNLCINALDAMPRGGKLQISTRRAGAKVQLQVKDTGEGMPPEVLARAMEPFYTTKPVGRGTGLGLSIVYGTMKAHGGSVEIQSEPGRGTTVTLSFPALPDEVLAQAPEPVAAPTEAHRLRVLLVDDDELIRAAVPTLLESLGHLPEVASGGLEALRRLEAGMLPDVVILDLNMPGMGGVQVLERIRLIQPRLPVLIATGFKSPEAEALLAAHPDVDLIMKPYAREELRQKLGGLAKG